MNNYYYHKNRGHSGKKQPIKSVRNYVSGGSVGGGGGIGSAAAGYMVMNSPKGEFPPNYNQGNYYANSPQPTPPQNNFHP